MREGRKMDEANQCQRDGDDAYDIEIDDGPVTCIIIKIIIVILTIIWIWTVMRRKRGTARKQFIINIIILTSTIVAKCIP